MANKLTTLLFDREHFEQVVLQGIMKAKVSLVISTADFKSMLLPRSGQRKADSVLQLFRTLSEQGVEIRLLHSGVPTRPILKELKKKLPQNLIIRRCPRLHAKFIIIDARRMYLGSANLTGAGLGAKSEKRRNFEAGIWTSDTDFIDKTEEHFNALWEGNECAACGRKSICPVPLEEPF